jgi:hypothetical protein
MMVLSSAHLAFDVDVSAGVDLLELGDDVLLGAQLNTLTHLQREG